MPNRSITQMTRFDCFDSNYILENFMHTKPENLLFQERISAVYRSIRENQFEEADAEIAILKELLGNNHPDILALKGEYKRSKYRYEKNQKG